MENEKYGFVYIWYDRKHKRYYIGCHWGTTDDGYICSSNWMRDAYRRRPNDFKRRILIKVDNRKELLDEEYRFLSMIKPEELRVKYYNLNNHKHNHWTINQDTRSIRQKISENTKAAMQRPEVREKYLAGMAQKDYKPTQETIEKRRKTMIKTLAEKFPLEKRRQRLARDSEELLEIYRQKTIELWKNRSEEERAVIGKKIAESNKGIKRRLGQTNSKEHRARISASLKGKTREPKECPHCGKFSKPGRWHFDNCKDKIK